ncbi:hypothetical protein SAY86_029052 [Trapa natans]|uniref:Uncharacterized protein n=1 Tax=Trapa natans TaxID=22666 RepID=A0AAN7RF71_TRANT|nr:hypothetical protein SAY86_029052 [Trapa natans]
MKTEAVAVWELGRWGTWEELILGGAVLRHGAGDWELVASELRSRIPYDFTPEVKVDDYSWNLDCCHCGHDKSVASYRKIAAIYFFLFNLLWCGSRI